MTEIKVIQNDKLYDLNFTLQDSNGNAVDITSSTIKFKVQKVGDTVLKINASMSIVSGAAGTCKYQVQAADFDSAGKYYAEVEVTFSSSQITTFSGIVVIVDPELPKS
mgnify:CR=1 FL=1